MYNQCKPIKKKQLIFIVNSLYSQTHTKYKRFIQLWKDFILKYANDTIFFYDSNNNTNNNETFLYNMCYLNQNFAIYFNIERISQFISTDNIRYNTIQLSDFKNHLIYSNEENMTNRKKINDFPIIIYFPILNSTSDYLVIDGNHRITNNINNNINCTLTLIKPNDLRLSCFSDFNSWIIYHFLTNYYGIMHNDDRYIEQFINQSNTLINSVISTLSLDQ